MEKQATHGPRPSSWGGNTAKKSIDYITWKTHHNSFLGRLPNKKEVVSDGTMRFTTKFIGFNIENTLSTTRPYRLFIHTSCWNKRYNDHKITKNVMRIINIKYNKYYIIRLRILFWVSSRSYGPGRNPKMPDHDSICKQHLQK